MQNIRFGKKFVTANMIAVADREAVNMDASTVAVAIFWYWFGSFYTNSIYADYCRNMDSVAQRESIESLAAQGRNIAAAVGYDIDAAVAAETARRPVSTSDDPIAELLAATTITDSPLNN